MGSPLGECNPETEENGDRSMTCSKQGDGCGLPKTVLSYNKGRVLGILFSEPAYILIRIVFVSMHSLGLYSEQARVRVMAHVLIRLTRWAGMPLACSACLLNFS